MNNKVFLVLGTGRCGTSTVARILHEKIGVYMGNEFRDGHYEDLAFKDINDSFLDGYRSNGNNIHVIGFPEWYDKINKLIEKRNKEHEMWGFKDPRATILSGIFLSIIGSCRIIVCKRNEQDTIKSMVANTNWDHELAQFVYRERKRIILNNTYFIDDDICFSIDFNERREDKWIEEEIRRAFCIDRKMNRGGWITKHIGFDD